MTEPGTPTTVLDALNHASHVIEDARVGDTPRLDAELLVGHVTELDRAGLRIHSDRVLDRGMWQRLDRLVGRRIGGEPIAYLLESAWFYGREYFVDPRVLIPRPETELLVEVALTHFADHATSATFVDACTGSGCVAVSIAAELQGRAHVHATDISPEALQVAATNAARHGVDIELHAGDLLDPVLHLENVAVVVANPPYVEHIDADGLEAGVRDHEPHIALFPPHGGVGELYARLAHEAIRILAPGGLLAVEHGLDQHALVRAALTEAGFVDTAAMADLAGIDRVVVGRRPAKA